MMPYCECRECEPRRARDQRVLKLVVALLLPLGLPALFSAFYF